ncbi:hypothetical protein Agub_g2056, partial [Astrephomene gubernaculifera]
MELGSPRSPTVQFPVSGPTTNCVCPNAPRKPAFRREQQTGNFDTALTCARESLEVMSEEERQAALKHLPRHTLEGVFLAFCHWQAGSQLGLDFQNLLALAP